MITNILKFILDYSRSFVPFVDAVSRRMAAFKYIPIGKRPEGAYLLLQLRAWSVNF